MSGGSKGNSGDRTYVATGNGTGHAGISGTTSIPRTSLDIPMPKPPTGTTEAVTAAIRSGGDAGRRIIGEVTHHADGTVSVPLIKLEPPLHTVTLAFKPGQRVSINALDDVIEKTHLVVEVSIGIARTQYLVRYWHEGDRKEAWFLADELAS